MIFEAEFICERCGDVTVRQHRIRKCPIQVCCHCHKRTARLRAVVDLDAYFPLRGCVQRWEVLNKLISAHAYESYLEVGLGSVERSFPHVLAAKKESVDLIEKDATYRMSSDEFFAGPGHDGRWDLIFIDGDHGAEQARRDIENGLARLNPDGAVVVHDCDPMGESSWNGEVWKEWVRLRQSRPDLNMKVIDVDHGCGVIQAGEQTCSLIDLPINYADFDHRRAELLNLVHWPVWLSSIHSEVMDK